MSKLIRLITLFLLLAQASVADAQLLPARWISHPAAEAGRHVWFRQTITLAGEPAQASIVVGTTGRVDIYVNECNVTSDVLVPHRRAVGKEPINGPLEGSLTVDNGPLTKPFEAISIEYDISHFLYEGENSIAIWYSPEDMEMTDEQVVAVVKGRYENGKRFFFGTDESWLCRWANRQNTPRGEKVDGNAYRMKWCSDDYDAALWVRAKADFANNIAVCLTPHDRYEADIVNKIRPQDYFDVESGKAYYVFRSAFTGWVRVTFRGAKAGERVFIDGLEYICKGTTDEQACLKFTVEPHRRVLITGDNLFQPDQISTVEGIEIVPYFHTFSF